MSDIAVRATGLSKRYRIGGVRHTCSYNTLRDSLLKTFRDQWRRLSRLSRNGNGEANNIWALKDVSFEVKQGEIIGLIGRNGAGKSTLLKVLSRITEPTDGEAEVHGRVGSLLEVGTGFHPELTGRENTYLNGAILGMKRAEINRKFDEIVAFAEVEKFIDTPAKHYSSGMFLRLAFSVAAHLETEILLVDEVLAVGDASFQKRCLGKMDEVAHQGRTVFFVSHNMGTINSLCPTSFLLDHGELTQIGPSSEVVSRYLGSNAVSAYTEVGPDYHIKGDQAVRVERIMLTTPSGEPRSNFQIWEPMRIHIGFRDTGKVSMASFLVMITAADGQPVSTSYQNDVGELVRLPSPFDSVQVTIPSLLLTPGEYLISVAACGAYRQIHDWVEHALAFRVLPNIYEGGSFENRPGRVMERWQFEPGRFPKPAVMN